MPGTPRSPQGKAASVRCPHNLDLLGRNLRLPVANILIVLADLGADVIQMAVDAIGFEATTLGAAAADLPKRLRKGKLRAELRDAAVDCDTTMTGTTF